MNNDDQKISQHHLKSLVLGLNDLRDALVEASLALKDYQFFYDTSEAELASIQASEVIETVQTKKV